jgi:hypothetical protein
VIAGTLASAQAEHEFVLTEGAGSPAEINLRDTALANMRTAKAAGARVLAVAEHSPAMLTLLTVGNAGPTTAAAFRSRSASKKILAVGGFRI